MPPINLRSVVVGSAIDSGVGQLLHLSFDEGFQDTGIEQHAFAMTGELYTDRKQEDLFNEARAEFRMVVLGELARTNYLCGLVEVENLSIEKVLPDYLVMEEEVALWVMAPDKKIWGIGTQESGQMCDCWEKEEGVDWFISRAEYLRMLTFWREHHLRKLGEVGYAVTPPWMIDLARESLLLTQGFRRWWWMLTPSTSSPRSAAGGRGCRGRRS